MEVNAEDPRTFETEKITKRGGNETRERVPRFKEKKDGMAAV